MIPNSNNLILELPPHVESYAELAKPFVELYHTTWFKLEQALAEAMDKQHEPKKNMFSAQGEVKYIAGCDPYDKESESFSNGVVKGDIIEYKTNRK